MTTHTEKFSVTERNMNIIDLRDNNNNNINKQTEIKIEIKVTDQLGVYEPNTMTVSTYMTLGNLKRKINEVSQIGPKRLIHFNRDGSANILWDFQNSKPLEGLGICNGTQLWLVDIKI